MHYWKVSKAVGNVRAQGADLLEEGAAD